MESSAYTSPTVGGLDKGDGFVKRQFNCGRCVSTAQSPVSLRTEVIHRSATPDPSAIPAVLAVGATPNPLAAIAQCLLIGRAPQLAASSAERGSAWKIERRQKGLEAPRSQD